MTTSTRDELLIDGGLIYSLRDGANHTEVNVTMAYGSRITAARYALAEEIRDLLCAHQAQAEPLTLAVLGRKHFGNPIPKEWYAAARELQASGATSSDQTSLDEYKRRLADMCREYQALSVKADQTWNEAIEAANAECQAEFEHVKEIGLAEAMAACMTIQDRLRKLVRPSQAQEPVELGMSMFASRAEYEAACMAQAQEHCKPVSGAVDEREAFEKWASDPVRADKLPLDRWPANDGYKDVRTYTAFYGWKARAAVTLSRAQQAPAAWMTENGDRVVTAATMSGAHKDGGAILSSLRPFTIPLVPAAAPVSEQIATREAEREGFWPVDDRMSRKQLILQIGKMNYRLTALRKERDGLAGKLSKLRATKTSAAAPVSAQQAPAQSVERQELSDADIDRYLNAVLRAAGSALSHYTMQKSIDDMRAAMRSSIEKDRGRHEL